MLRKTIWLLDTLILIGIAYLSYQRQVGITEYYTSSPLYIKLILIIVALLSLYITFKKPKGSTKSFRLDSGAQSFKKQRGNGDIKKPLMLYIADEVDKRGKRLNFLGKFRIVCVSLFRFLKPVLIMFVCFLLAVMLVWLILMLFKQ